MDVYRLMKKKTLNKLKKKKKKKTMFNKRSKYCKEWLSFYQQTFIDKTLI